jgi:hypothetical protein
VDPTSPERPGQAQKLLKPRDEENIYLVRSLETGETVVWVAAPIKLTKRERWSWKLGRVVQVH